MKVSSCLPNCCLRNLHWLIYFWLNGTWTFFPSFLMLFFCVFLNLVLVFGLFCFPLFLSLFSYAVSFSFPFYFFSSSTSNFLFAPFSLYFFLSLSCYCLLFSFTLKLCGRKSLLRCSHPDTQTPACLHVFTSLVLTF